MLGTVRKPDELPVGEAHVRMREEADVQVRIEARRLALGDAQDAAALGLLRRDRVLPRCTLFPREIFRRDEEER